jgi:hypothetical protein
MHDLCKAVETYSVDEEISCTYGTQEFNSLITDLHCTVIIKHQNFTRCSCSYTRHIVNSMKRLISFCAVYRKRTRNCHTL